MVGVILLPLRVTPPRQGSEASQASGAPHEREGTR